MFSSVFTKYLELECLVVCLPLLETVSVSKAVLPFLTPASNAR